MTEADALFQRASAIARCAGDQRLELRALGDWAIVAYHVLDLEDEEQSIREGLRLFWQS